MNRTMARINTKTGGIQREKHDDDLCGGPKDKQESPLLTQLQNQLQWRTASYQQRVLVYLLAELGTLTQGRHEKYECCRT